MVKKRGRIVKSMGVQDRGRVGERNEERMGEGGRRKGRIKDSVGLDMMDRRVLSC